MTTLLAPPELCSAFAVADEGRDPDLRRGTHLRLYAGLGASFPLMPFAVFRVRSRPSEPNGIHMTDRRGGPVGQLDLSQHGMIDATLLLADTNTRRTVQVECLPDDPAGLEGAQLLDQRGRVVAERNAPPWVFSAPILHKIRLWGTASAVRIRTRTMDVRELLDPAGGGPVTLASVLGLPLQGRRSWYLGLQDRDAGLRRVSAGAPCRLSPVDRPQGPMDALDEADEVARVEALLRSSPLGGGFERLLEQMVDDRARPPWLQMEKSVLAAAGGRQQVARVPRLGAVQLSALDPGLARFLGFADALDDLPSADPQAGWDTLAVVGRFALDLKAFATTDAGLAQLLNEADPSEPAVSSLLFRALQEEQGNEDVREAAEQLSRQVQEQELLTRTLVTFVSPVAPWLPPVLPRPQIQHHHWQTADGAGGNASALYRIGFAFPNAPLGSLSAAAVQLGDTWTSRHDTVEVGPREPARRAKPRTLGYEREASARLINLNPAPGTYAPAALLTDQDLPADAGTLPYRVWLGDCFGRFGEPVTVEVFPPPRPLPPPPVLRFDIVRTVPPPDSLAPVSAGVLKLSVAVPELPPAPPFPAAIRSRLASAIQVPSITELAAGALPLQWVRVTLDDQTTSVDLRAPGLTELQLPLPELLPMEQRSIALKTVFEDSGGQQSAETVTAIALIDARPPHPIPTGIGLFWSSAPGPSPDVELALSWPAPPESLHRVYLTDQQGLGLGAADFGGLPDHEPSRGHVAQMGAEKVLEGGAVDRRQFRLLTERPVKAGGDGRTVFVTTLPRSLTTVQFLRVVPVSAQGVEAPFDRCGIVPVAVPESRRPSAPRLDSQVDPETGHVTLVIWATGVDRRTLERDEPGLFDPPAEGREPPRFRVRRAVGAVSDPLYARPLRSGTLELNVETGAWTATAVDTNQDRGLEPFVYYVYWAEYQLPPERRLPAGVQSISPPGGVVTLNSVGAADAPRPISLTSAPRTLMHIPAAVPDVPAPDTVSVTRTAPDGAGLVALNVSIAQPPQAHAMAVGPYRLALWVQWEGQTIQPVTGPVGAVTPGTWAALQDGQLKFAVPLPAGLPADSPLTFRLAIVDPAGRSSSVTSPAEVVLL